MFAATPTQCARPVRGSFPQISAIAGLFLVYLASMGIWNPAFAEPPTFADNAYSQLDRFRVEENSIVGWVAAGGKAMESGEGLYYFEITPSDGAPSYACRANSTSQVMDGNPAVHLDMFVHDNVASSTKDNLGNGSGIRVASQLFRTPAGGYEDARDMIEEVVVAASDWNAHKETKFLTAAYSGDFAQRRHAWRQIMDGLQVASKKHPTHLGILRDLIVAYGRLNAFERSTDLRPQLATAIPSRIAEYEWRTGGLRPDEAICFRRVLATLYFQLELYPEASIHVSNSPQDPQLDKLAKAMKALGQGAFELTDEFVVNGELMPYKVLVHQTKARRPQNAMIFHHWYFMPRPADESIAPGRTWFTVSSQILTDSPRYYLYGVSTSQRKLLRMYGKELPTYDSVKAEVIQLIDAALSKQGDNSPAKGTSPIN